jgi:DNA-binding MarR family transcriptional regulator
MTEPAGSEQLDRDLFRAFAEVVGLVLGAGQRLAERHQIPVFAVKALHWLDGGLAMKELGQRLRCDPSFVTAVADLLEERGLARREPSPADRRVKNLVLTPEGLALKERLEHEMVASMPWGALEPAERRALLALIRKLTAAARQPGTRVPAGARVAEAGPVKEEVSG